MTEAERKWVNTEPGVLVLVGTDWRITYEPQGTTYSFYACRQGDRLVGRATSLSLAKAWAEQAQADLEEIGMG